MAMRETNHLRKQAKERMASTGKNPRRRVGPTTTQGGWCFARDKRDWEHGAFVGKCPKCEKEENEG